MDISGKLPGNYNELRTSVKWAERKEAIEALRKVLQGHDSLASAGDVGEFIGDLNKMLAKDANINVQALVAECVGLLAEGMKQKFASYAPAMLPVALEKFKEKKPVLREPLSKCVDLIGSSLPSLETVQEEIQGALGKPNPQIKQQTLLFLSRNFNQTLPAKQPKKLIKALIPIMYKLTGDADADVREAATTVLGSVQRLVGEKALNVLLTDLKPDKAKLEKITEAEGLAKKAFEEFNAAQNDGDDDEDDVPATTSSGKAAAAGSGGSAKPKAKAAVVEEPKEADPWDFIDEYAILDKMPDDFYGLIESKKWTERRDVLQSLNDSLRDHPRLDAKGNYGELVAVLKKIIEKDANINVIALAATALKGLSDGLRGKFSQHTTSLIPPIFEKFKEKKPIVKDALVALIDALSLHTSLETIHEDVMTAFGKPNPNIKKETNLFIYRHMKTLNAQTASKKAIKALVPLIVKTSGDSDGEVRDASYQALGSIMRIVGEKVATTMFEGVDKSKMEKIKEICDAAIKEVGPAEAKKAPPPKAPEAKPVVRPGVKPKAPKPKVESEPEEEEEPEPEPEEVKPKKAPAAKAKVVAEPEKKEEEVLLENNEKARRIKDERALKVLKWNFQAPTDEHVQQLQQQFSDCAKMNLVQLLFQKDFKLHIKAVDMVLQAGEQNPNLLIVNSDLLLKWATLRFFETNPAALTKVLTLCLKTLTLLHETETTVSSEEVNAFVPYLLLKTGETKDNIRSQVREVVNVLTDMVGPVKMLPHLLDSLKSKNSRQRAECLTIIHSYVETVGSAIFRQLSLEKLVAPHVADKDVNVRSAAINVLCESFRYEGENMWKLAGKMADKEKSLIQERIKRNKVTLTPAPPVFTSTPKAVRGGGADARQDTTMTQGNATFTSVRPSNSLNAVSELNPVFSLRSDRYALDDDFIISGPSEFASPPPAPLRRTLSSSSISSIDTSDQIKRSLQNVSSALPDFAKDAIYQVIYLIENDEQKDLVLKNLDILFQAAKAQVVVIMLEKQKGNFLYDVYEALTQMLFLLTGVNSSQGPMTNNLLIVKVETFGDLMSAILELIRLFGDNQQDLDGINCARTFNRVAMRMLNSVDKSVVLCGLLRELTSHLHDAYFAELYRKLMCKWEEGVNNVRVHIPMVIKTFDMFYAASKDDKFVQTVDNVLEKIVARQGRCLLDEARRLPEPTLHLTSFLNKCLQLMAENNVEPTLPGSAPSPYPNEKKSEQSSSSSIGPATKSAGTSEVAKLVDGFLAEPNSLATFYTRIGLLISKDVHWKELKRIIKTHESGRLIQTALKSFKENNKPEISEEVRKCLAVKREMKEQRPKASQAQKPQKRERTIMQDLSLPMRNRSINPTGTITRPRVSMTRNQFDEVRAKLASEA